MVGVTFPNPQTSKPHSRALANAAFSFSLADECSILGTLEIPKFPMFRETGMGKFIPSSGECTPRLAHLLCLLEPAYNQPILQFKNTYTFPFGIVPP
jgi:hypothetical protein